jgi:CPA2 family monovalent cation:H+ antiporter-2
MILAESELSHRAAEETLPLRDAFAVLFFVSVGMLFNPMVVFADPWPVLATLGIIVAGKAVAAFAIVKAFRHTTETALVIAASLAQIGEFSFILASLGADLKLLPTQGRDLILAGAILSIVLNPLVFSLAAGLSKRRKAPAVAEPAPANDLFPTALTEHTILVGYGRVGRVVAEGLDAAEEAFLVIEDRSDFCQKARGAGVEVIEGNATDGRIQAAARVRDARRLLVAVPDGFEAGQIVEQARRANPDLAIVARAHSDEEVDHLMAHGADETILGEAEIARAMLERVVVRRAPADAGGSGRTIFDDAERALLAGLKSHGVGPGEAVSLQVLLQSASRMGAFDEGRLDAAVESLKANGCLRALGDGRVSPTKEGFLAAAASRVDY